MKGPPVTSREGAVRLSKGPSAGQSGLPSEKDLPPVIGPTVDQRGPSVYQRGPLSFKSALGRSKGIIFLVREALLRFIEVFRRSEGGVDRSVGSSVE